MNRFAKGGIAVGAGVLLLLGGGGTFALWNDSANLNGGQVMSGKLDLTTTGYAGHWYRYVSGQALSDYDAADALPAGYKVVPGDDLVFVGSGLGLTAEGGRLSFTVGVDATGLTSGNGFTVTNLGVQEVGASHALPAPTSGGVYTIDSSNGVVNATLDAGVEVSFDASGTANQSQTLDLASATVKVQQVPAS